MATFELTVKSRQDIGKGASRRLRRLADQVPGIIYGGEHPPIMISVDHNQLSKALSHEAFYSHILTIVVDGKAEKAVLKDVQRHPYKSRILHLDLLRITGKEKINMTIPFHFIGSDKAPGLKNGGVISHNLSDIEVRCLPDNLPEYIEIDLSNFDIDSAIHLSEVKFPAGVESVELSHGHDSVVASMHLPRAGADDEESKAEEIAPSEVPVAEKGKEANETQE